MKHENQAWIVQAERFVHDLEIKCTKYDLIFGTLSNPDINRIILVISELTKTKLREIS